MKGNLTVKKWKNKGAFGRKKAMKTNKICKQVVFIWKAEWNNNVIKSQFITQTITIAFDCKDNNFNCSKINCSKNCSAAKLQLLDTCRADLKKKLKLLKDFVNILINCLKMKWWTCARHTFSVERLIFLKKVLSSCDLSRWVSWTWPPPFQLKKR